MSKKKASSSSKKASSYTPIVIVVGGVLLLAVALFALWKAEQPSADVSVEVSGRPSLKVDREKVELGDVKVGEIVSVSFQLANVGDKPLSFTSKPYIEVVEGC